MLKYLWSLTSLEILCSCAPLYNFTYIYGYIMASPKSFVDRYQSISFDMKTTIVKQVSCVEDLQRSTRLYQKLLYNS